MAQNLAKQIEHRIKGGALSAMAVMRWGTTRPKRVRPRGAAGEITINPDDPLARKKLVHDTLRNKLRFHRMFMKHLCEQADPDLALDIGVNYGECLFTPAYRPGTTVLGFEANPELDPYIESSIVSHPQGGQIHLCSGLVGEEHGGEADFHIDTQWSGASSAAKLFDEEGRYTVVKRPKLSVDGAVADKGLSPRGVVFKIDVEGYESYVINGMQNTLGQADWSVGLIEFNPVFATSAGVDVRRYYDRLHDAFHVYGVSPSGGIVDLKGKDISAVGVEPGSDPGKQLASKQPFPDLVLTRGDVPEAFDQLARQ